MSKKPKTSSSSVNKPPNELIRECCLDIGDDKCYSICRYLDSDCNHKDYEGHLKNFVDNRVSSELGEGCKICCLPIDIQKNIEDIEDRLRELPKLQDHCRSLLVNIKERCISKCADLTFLIICDNKEIKKVFIIDCHKIQASTLTVPERSLRSKFKNVYNLLIEKFSISKDKIDCVHIAPKSTENSKGITIFDQCCILNSLNCS